LKNRKLNLICSVLSIVLLATLAVVTSGCGTKTTTTTTTSAVVNTTLTLSTIGPPEINYILIANGSPITLRIGDTKQYTATAAYSDSNNVDITNKGTWNSTDPTVATVSSSGLVTAVAQGNTVLSISLDGTNSGSVNILVKPQGPIVLSIAVSRSVISNLTVGDIVQLKANGSISDGTIKDITSEVTWNSSDPSIATISAKGLVTAIKAGKTTISASQLDVNSIGIVLTIDAK
jgi:hypothetical protein